MNSLTDFLLQNAESLIGKSVRASQSTMERADCHLYLWEKMGMTHKLLAMGSPAGSGWQSVAPASHLYTLNKSELASVKYAVDQCYLSLMEELKEPPKGLMYVIKSGSNWELFCGKDSYGFVDPNVDKVEYAFSAESGLIMFLQWMSEKLPVITHLCSCIVLPFGVVSSSGWQYANTVTVLGKEELSQFQGTVVENMAMGVPVVPFSVSW